MASPTTRYIITATDESARAIQSAKAKLLALEKAANQTSGGMASVQRSSAGAATGMTGLQRTAASATSGLAAHGAALGSLVSGYAGLAVAIGAGLAFRATITGSIEAEQAMTQLNAALESTKGAAGFTAAELGTMAGAFQKLTPFEDDAVVKTEALLLTFTKLRGDVFPRALEAVLNMSTALGQDLKSSAIQVGKALQDPAKGVTALRRVGVDFNESQTEVIKNLVATGQQAKAQAMILKELQIEFGGSARAAKDTFGGAIQSLSNSFGNLLEIHSLGGATAAVKEFQAVLEDPTVKQFATQTLMSIVQSFKEIGEAIKPTINFINDLREKYLELSIAALEFGQNMPWADKELYGSLIVKTKAQLIDLQRSVKPVKVVEDPDAAIKRISAAANARLKGSGMADLGGPIISSEDADALAALMAQLFPAKAALAEYREGKELINKAEAAGIPIMGGTSAALARLKQNYLEQIREIKEATDAQKKLAETTKAIRSASTDAQVSINREKGLYQGVSQGVIDLARSQGILGQAVSSTAGYWIKNSDGTHEYHRAVVALDPRLAELNKKMKEASQWKAAGEAISANRTDLQEYQREAQRLNGLLPIMAQRLGSTAAAHEVVRRALADMPWAQKRAEMEANAATVKKLTADLNELGLSARQLARVKDVMGNMKLSGGSFTNAEVDRLRAFIEKMKELRDSAGQGAWRNLDQIGAAVRRLAASQGQLRAAGEVIRGNQSALQQYQAQAARLNSLIPALTQKLGSQAAAHRQVAMTLRGTEMGQMIQQYRLEAQTAGQVAQKLRDLGVSARQAAQAKALLGKGAGHFVSPQEATNVQQVMDKLRQLATMKGVLTPLELKIQVRRAIKSLDDVEKSGSQMAQDVQSECQSMGSTVSDAFAEMAMTGKFSFEDMTKSILSDILRIVAYQALIAPLFGGGLGGAGGGLFFAKGGVFDKGQVKKFAKGGVVNKPTVFPMARGMGLMGEKGPEAVMPLQRTRGGDLGVRASGGNGGGNNYISVITMEPMQVSQQKRGGDNYIEFESQLVKRLGRNTPIRGAVNRATGTSPPTSN